jgi:hypothetical protein
MIQMPKIKSAERNKQLPPTRVSEKELTIIQRKADELNMTLSDYIRLVAINSKIKIEVKK